jgi:hypothetical protein
MNTVFVAMITTTYESTLSKSREEWMMDMYKVCSGPDTLM